MATGREERKEVRSPVVSIDGTWLEPVGHTRAAVALGGLFISFDLKPVWREYAKALGVEDLTEKQKMQAVFNEAMRRAEDVSG